ncbi:hypothetical protein [Synergistes jonesii]|uniref:hypothetical protein n=1 Tax=Synergistes jonesii TaxID=2754 RepID=UPI0024309586|nr:hypothetical protein [Synergistes jonesii]
MSNQNSALKEEDRNNYSFVFVGKNQKRYLICLLFVVVIGWGPGMMLVNKPKLICGIPYLWAWWISWYILWIILMYGLVFKSGQRDYDKEGLID